MVFKQTLRKIFEKGNPGLGWFVLWRMALFIIPLNLLTRLIAEQSGSNPAAGFSFLFALPVGNNLYLVPVAIPIILLLWNWLGKLAMEKKLGKTPKGFVGWSLYWRFVLLQLAGLLVLGLIFTPIALMAQTAGDQGLVVFGGLAALVGLPALVYWNLNVVGFVIKKVSVLTPGKAPEKAGAGKSLQNIRDYRLVFDDGRFGTNWMFAAAYVVSGLIGSLAYPFIEAVFTGMLEYTPGVFFIEAFIGFSVAGTALTLILHRVKIEWQVAVLFSGVMALTLVLVENPLSMVLEDRSGEWQLLETAPVISRLIFGALFGAGLLMGIRFLGPTIGGFALGIAAAQVLHFTFINPVIYAVSMDLEPSYFMGAGRMAIQFFFSLFDAGITGLALWWACDWHLGRKNLRLDQTGSILARGKGGV